MSNYVVYLGAVGWEHEAWRGDLYPEDLPEDWRLSFYNTQFRCVYLPYEMWRKATDDEVANWLHETREGFRFLLEAPEGLNEDAAAKARRFGDRGVLASQMHVIRLKGEPDLRKLAQRIQEASQSGVSLYVISEEAALNHLRKISSLMEVLGV